MTGRRDSRSAFTLLEMAVAVSIFSVTVAGAGVFIAGAYRMTKEAFARVSLSMQIRETRERLLFKAIPEHGGVVYAGVLSGTNTAGVVESLTNPFKILMSIGGMGAADGSVFSPRSRNMQLLREGGHFQNDDYRAGAPWLRPMRADVVPSLWLSAYDSGETVPRAVAVTLGGVVDGVGLTNRTVVPVFGAVQYYRNSAPSDSTTALWGGEW